MCGVMRSWKNSTPPRAASSGKTETTMPACEAEVYFNAVISSEK